MIDLFGLPLSSIVLFVLAGVLIGHLLWYQDRAIQREKLEGLENRYFKARGAARQRKSRYLQLQRLTQAQRSDVDQLQKEHDELLAAHTESENQLAEKNRELARLGSENKKNAESLAAETRRSESMVQQLREVLETNHQLEQKDQLQASEIVALKQEVDRFRQQLEQSQAELDVQVQVVREHQDTIAQLREESATALEQLRSASQSELNQMSETLTRTQQDLVARCADLDQVRSERDDLNARLEHALQQARYFDAQRTRIEEIVREREEMAADLQSAADSLGQQRELLESREVDLGLLNEELSHLRSELKTATELLDQNAEAQRELLATIDHRDAAIVELEQQVEQLHSAREEIQALAEAVADRDQIIESHRNQLQSNQEAFLHSEGILETHRLEIQAQRETIAALEATGEEELRRERERAEQLQATVDALRAEIDELCRQIQRISELEASVESLTATSQKDAAQVAELERIVSEKDQVIDRQSTDLRKLAEELDTLEPLKGQLAETSSLLQLVQARGDELERQCLDQNAQIERLQSETLQLESLQETLDQTLVKLDLSQEETAGARSNIEELRQQLEALHVSAARSQTELEQLRSIETSLRAELEVSQAEHAETQASHAQLSSQHDQLKSQLDQLQGSWADQQNQWDQHRRTSASEIERYRSEINEMQSSIDVQTRSIGDLQRQLSERCGLQESATREAHELQQRLQTETTRQHQLEKTNRELQQRVAELTGHLKRLSAELEDSLEANAQAHDQIRNLRRQRGSIPDLGDDRKAA